MKPDGPQGPLGPSESPPELGSDSATIAQRPQRSLPPSSKSDAPAPGTPSSIRPSSRSRSSIRPQSATGASLGGPSMGTPSRSLRTASDSVIADALIEEEAMRAHGFAAIIATVTGVVGAMLPLIGGHPVAKQVCLIALLTMCMGSVAVWFITRRPTRYTWAVHRTYSALLATCVLAVEYYTGFFSPVPVALTLGIYFIGQSSDRLSSFVIPIVAIFCYALLALLTTLGVLEDRSLFPAYDSELSSKLFAIAAVSVVLGLTIRMARVARASVRDAMKKSHDALLIAGEREAQLEEARQNLDRALKAAVGKPGRFTGNVAGDFALDVVIGVGAMGEVYAASRPGDEREGAVKLLQADAMMREDLVERFIREGQICQQLRSPNVVEVFDVGRMATGEPYLAMERLHGEDLAGWLRRDGHLTLPDAVTLVTETASGLQAAHDAGIVHRDLKPHNLFYASDREGAQHWKILDFGVSKLSGTDGTLTEHTVVGTPGYMSPEQARGKKVDHRSDLFALAVVLYRSLTGRQPFTGPNAPEILFEIVYKSPDRPSALRPELPSDVDLVIAIALAKHANHRFQSAKEMAQAFSSAARRRLPPEIRARGFAVVNAYPWGKTLVAAASNG